MNRKEEKKNARNGNIAISHNNDRNTKIIKFYYSCFFSYFIVYYYFSKHKNRYKRQKTAMLKKQRTFSFKVTLNDSLNMKKNLFIKENVIS